MRKKQSVQAIRRGVRVDNETPGDRINSGVSGAYFRLWFYSGSKNVRFPYFSQKSHQKLFY